MGKKEGCTRRKALRGHQFQEAPRLWGGGFEPPTFPSAASCASVCLQRTSFGSTEGQPAGGHPHQSRSRFPSPRVSRETQSWAAGRGTVATDLACFTKPPTAHPSCCLAQPQRHSISCHKVAEKPWCNPSGQMLRSFLASFHPEPEAQSLDQHLPSPGIVWDKTWPCVSCPPSSFRLRLRRETVLTGGTAVQGEAGRPEGKPGRRASRTPVVVSVCESARVTARQALSESKGCNRRQKISVALPSGYFRSSTGDA